MARRTTIQSGSIDRVLSNQEMEVAIKKIDRRLAELDQFDVDEIGSRMDPRIRATEFAIKGLLTDIFGSDSTQFKTYQGIAHLDRASININYSTPIQEVRDGLRQGIDEAITVLKSIKSDWEADLEADFSGPGRSIRAYDGLDLHPDIARQVGTLFQDGHHAEAVEKAVKALNALVRMRSELELDGTALMERAFSPKNPILAFNGLSDPSDQDEQRGFMALFVGAVMGLRNPRAHRITKDSPERALEFIAFISLLAKLLDEAKYVSKNSGQPPA
jgi:uncharacterized protein (TIGR02391 family)